MKNFFVNMFVIVLFIVFTTTIATEHTEITRSCASLKVILDKVCEVLDGPDFNDTLTEISGLTELFCQKFQDTWTLIASLDTTVTFSEFDGEFSSIFTVIQEIEDTLCRKFQETWTILQCTPPMQLSEPTTITQSGEYCMTQDIEGTVTIATQGVTIDMNHFKISTTQPTGIEFSSQGTILIKNGVIENTTLNAIDFDGSSIIEIDSVDFVANATAINGVDSSLVKINNCTFRGNSGDAICFDNVNNVQVTHLIAKSNTGDRVISVINSECVGFENVDVRQNSFAGIAIYNVMNFDSNESIQFHNCHVDGNESTSATSMRCWFLTACNGIILNNCSANRNNGNSLFGYLLSNTCRNFFGIGIEACINNNLTNAGRLFSATSLINGKLENVIINNNTEQGFGDTMIPFFLNAVANVEVENIQLSDNESIDDIDVLRIGAFSECIKIHNAMVSNNSSLTGTANNVYVLSSRDVVLDKILSTDNSANPARGTFVESSTNIIFCNAEAKNNSGAISYGHHALNSQLVNYQNCVSNINTGTTSISVGFLAEQCADVTYEQCVAFDNVGTIIGRGFDLLNSSIVSLANCSANHNSGTGADGEGLRVQNCGNIMTQDSQFVGNTGGLNGRGLVLQSSSTVIIENSVFNDNDTNGILLNSSNINTFLNNIINDNGSIGFSFVSSNTNTIKFNCLNNNDSGIVLDSVSTGNCLFGNTMQANDTAGITNNGINNSFFKNKAQENGTNYNGSSGVPIIAIFNLNSGTFTTAPTTFYDNLSVV